VFVIFGWGFTTTHVFGVVLPVRCPNCHNEQFWVLRRIRRWFTLFFIPVFPYESTHALMCPICGAGRELHGTELKRAKMYAEANTAFESGTLDQADYAARLSAISGATDAQVNKELGQVAAIEVPTPPPAEPATAAASLVTPSPPLPPRPVAVAPAMEAAPEGTANGSGFCAQCGRKFDADADLFCPRCGAPRAVVSGDVSWAKDL